MKKTPQNLIMTLILITTSLMSALYWHNNIQLQIELYETRTDLSRYKLKDTIMTRHIHSVAIDNQPQSEYIPVTHIEKKSVSIEDMIRKVFTDNPDDAIAIAKCESGMRADNVGDTHLMSINRQTGELVGDSIGLFQIRTGSSDWNRAYANGMSADDFRSWMSDPNENIKYAYEIFKRADYKWTPWFNCKNKLGL